MGSTEDDGELIDQLRLEIDILDRVLYRHTNQHRRAKYFKQLKIVRRKARLIVNSKDHHELDVDEIKDVQNLAVSAAETFTVLLGRSYFMPFALVCISLLAKIVSILQPIQHAILEKKKPSIISSAEVPNDSGANQKNVDSTVEKDLHALPQDSKTPTLNTSIDFLLSGKHTSTNLPDLDKKDVSYEKKRKKKKKKKKKSEKNKRQKKTGYSDDKDAIDDIFGF
eukprot:g4358.t1